MVGQLFYACAVDTDSRTCCTIAADKFDANCYSCCYAVATIHFLLRQKPYRVIWGGDYISSKLSKPLSETQLLALSTYIEATEPIKEEVYDSQGGELKSEQELEYKNLQTLKFLSESWNRLELGSLPLDYFNWSDTNSVRYTGFLVNHNKKLAIDLADYYERSRYTDGRAVDPLPVLTETGGGLSSLLFSGIECGTTETLARTWCFDLLQIVDDTPSGYTVIGCCFTEIWNMARYCYEAFGVNSDGLLLRDDKGNLFMGDILGRTVGVGAPCFMRVNEVETGTRYVVVPVEGKSRTVFYSQSREFLKCSSNFLWWFKRIDD